MTRAERRVIAREEAEEERQRTQVAEQLEEEAELERDKVQTERVARAAARQVRLDQRQKMHNRQIDAALYED